MVEIVISIAAKVTEYLVAPIEPHLRYLFRHRYLLGFLHAEVEKLRAKRQDVQTAVDEAVRRGDEIRPSVNNWLNLVDEITGEAEELMKDENRSCFHGLCPNLKSRYQLSREAHRMRRFITEIEMDGSFPDGVSYRVPPWNVISKNYEHWDSRASTLKKIMDALKDDRRQRIGVWGMGGVGKTILVKQVAQLAWQRKFFTTEVYIDMSWTRESGGIQQGIAKIQEQIAYATGLKFEGSDESTRAAELMKRLKREKILIILDDIWKEVDLREAGIPFEDGCKILLASRDLHLLCNDMGAEVYFPVKHLPLEEAWSLCKKQAGVSLEENRELRGVAIEVVKECEGLPIAIVTVAKALKGESVAIWENALDELRSSPTPTNIRGMDAKVYSSLKLSYDNLESEQVKRLFLLCGMLGFGDISMDYLLKYVMGSDLFERVSSLEQATEEVSKLVKILKDSSLLLLVDDRQIQYSFGWFIEDDRNKFFRMHRVVCAVARAIASQHPHWLVFKKALQSGDG